MSTQVWNESPVFSPYGAGMKLEDFELGDLVEVTNLSPMERRVLAGSSRTIANGDRGIVTETYPTDFRVQCGSNAAMEWEAQLRSDEVRLIARLGRQEATRRLFANSTQSAGRDLPSGIPPDMDSFTGLIAEATEQWSRSDSTGSVWCGRVMDLATVIASIAYFLNDRGYLALSETTIGELLRLDVLETLAWTKTLRMKSGVSQVVEPDFEALVGPLRSYLSDLPSYDRAAFGEQKTSTVEQHGYCTMLLTRTLAGERGKFSSR
jgi:hypothetical protein